MALHKHGKKNTHRKRTPTKTVGGTISRLARQTRGRGTGRRVSTATRRRPRR